MSRTKRHRHLSRTMRATLRANAEQRRRPTKIAAPVRDKYLFADPPVLALHDTPLRRDPDWLLAHDGFGLDGEERNRFRQILVAVLPHRPGLVDPPYVNFLRELVRAEWIREPAGWRPQGRGLGAGFRSLAAHLLGEYPVSPLLWDTLLIPEHADEVPWLGAPRFVSMVARGVSMRRLAGTEVMPAPLTRRMAHMVVNPPRPMSLIAMVRRAQVLACGGNESLAAALPGSGLGYFHMNEDYWATFIHWLCRQEQVPPAQILELHHYLGTMACENATVNLKGRSLHSLLREAARWRKLDDQRYRAYWDSRRMDAAAVKPERQPPCTIAEYESGEWTLKRIRTARRLIIEGCRMHHCVGTYGEDLRIGRCSFWSLSRGDKRSLTIEVHQASLTIEAVAGRANRFARAAEAVHVKAWAQANGLAIDDWCLPDEE